VAAEAFNDNLTRLKLTFTGIGYTLGRVLLPASDKLVQKFTAWAQRQREIIGTDFKDWVDNLDIDALWRRVENFLGSLKKILLSVNNLAQAFGGWENVMLGIIALISGKFLLSIANLIGQIGKLGALVMMNPLGKLLTTLTAIYAVYQNWDEIVQRWEKTFDTRVAPEMVEMEGWDVPNARRNAATRRLEDRELAQDRKSERDAALSNAPGDRDLDSEAARSNAPGDRDMDLDPEAARRAAPARAMDLAPAIREISEKRTEHVEKKNLILRVESPDGVPLSVRQPPGGNDFRVTQDGLIMDWG
jgi:hypothetical protein